MERYEAYKDSGVGWIGEIPEGWILGRTKNCFTHHKEIAGEAADNYERLALTMKGVLKRDKEDSDGLQPGSFDGYQILRENELVFKLIDLENIKTSRVGLSPYVGIVSPVYIIIYRGCDNRFSYYWYTNLYNNNVFNFLGGNGVRSALNASDLLNFPYPLLDEEEEQSIADFLDEKTAEIDDIVSETERSIELLREYRKSVISEAVTKGLDPDAPMKDSGVEWIGEIPEGWACSKVKFAFVNRDSQRVPIESSLRKQSDGGLYPYYGASGVVDYIDEYIFDEPLLLIGEDGANLRLRNLPIVYLAEGKYWVNNHAHILQPDTCILLKYAAFLLELADLENFLTGTTMPKLTQENLGNIPVVLPSLGEQKQIADYLDAKTSEIDALIADKERQVELLKEYRKSLISEAVTGKFKVPGVS